MHIPDYQWATIHADEFLLRTLKHEDAPLVYSAVVESFADLHPWMPWCHEQYSLSDSIVWCDMQESMWDNGIEYGFGIFHQRTKELLGCCGINRIDVTYKTGNLGYWVRSSKTKQGIATRATQILAAWGFERLQLRRIEIICSTENHASMRVAEKAGALREGVLRHRLSSLGTIHDGVLYSLLPEDIPHEKNV